MDHGRQPPAIGSDPPAASGGPTHARAMPSGLRDPDPYGLAVTDLTGEATRRPAPSSTDVASVSAATKSRYASIAAATVVRRVDGQRDPVGHVEIRVAPGLLHDPDHVTGQALRRPAPA